MNFKKVVNGIEYDFCYPDSHYIAEKICNEQHEGYQLAYETDGNIAKIFMQKQFHCQSYYENGESHLITSNLKKCLGWLIWLPETDTVMLRKTQVDSEKHEFHTGEELAVSYDIFKNLRDHDLIHIHSNSKDKDGKIIPMIFKIKKYKAAKHGGFKQFCGHGLQYFIPKSAFLAEVDISAKKKKSKTNRTKSKRKQKPSG